MGIAHWDEVERHRRAKGEMDAEWQSLGDAAGATEVGVNRVRVAPGRLPTPPHSHGASEELYYVLGGSGLAWQDEQVHEVRPGDCVIQRADSMEHTFVAGDDGLDYLVFGTRHPTEIGWLPRSRATPVWLAVGRGPRRRSLGRRGAGSAAGGGRAARPTAEHPERRRGAVEATAPGRAHSAAGDPRAQRSCRACTGSGWGAGRGPVAAALPLRGGGAVRHPRRDGDARAVALAGRRDARRRPRGHRDPSRPRHRAAAGIATSPTPSVAARAGSRC